MSDSAKAVFLSYASQDAEAARRICDALRQAGVEVWFDTDGGLEHGDEWDAKIRRQIKECVLFIPVISANTEAREEGYFRLEWDLAAERARTIASGVAFILPVVIDDTKEPTALVPDRFRTVQWTRLPGGTVPPEVLQRFLKLWSHRTGLLKQVSGSMEDRGQRTEDRTQNRASRPRWLAPVIAGGVIALLALILGRPWEKAAPPPAAAANPADAPTSEARQLVAKAWEQMNKAEMARAELEVADGFAKRATELEPNNADAWAAWSQVDSWYVYHNLDDSRSRREGSRTKAMRALQLAPGSYEPRLAQACSLVRSVGGLGTSTSLFDAEAKNLLTALLQEKPAEPRVLLALGILQRNTGQATEARATFEILAENPAWAALAWNEIAWAAYIANDFRAADLAVDRSIALQPCWPNLVLKVFLAAGWTGDLDQAKVMLEKIPVAVRQEDHGVTMACTVYWYRREPENMLRVLEGVSRDWLRSNAYDGPKAQFAALAHTLAGRKESAQLQWQAALLQVEQRLASQPDSGNLLNLKGQYLAMLGRREEAERVLQLAQDSGTGPGNYRGHQAQIVNQLLLGHEEAAITLVEATGDMPAFYYRNHPAFDPLRSNPRFQAVLARLEADPRFSPKAAPKAENKEPRTAPTPSLSTSPDAKSVAVLAFANLSDDKANEYFSDGISEELLNVLAKVQGLKVSARTSAFSFKGKEVPVPEIARQLGVAYVVEGSVRKQGNQVRITAQLIKAEDGFHVWSDTFTRDLKDIFAVQDEIAGLIAKNLELKIGVASASPAVVNPEAYQHLMRARYFSRHEDNEGRLKAVEECKAALAIDPDFALALAELARSYIHLTRFSGLGLEEGFAAARPAAERALRLNPELPEVQNAMGWVQRTADWDFRRALASFRRAYELAPQNSGIVADYSIMLNNLGQLDEAIALARRAVELDPLNVTTQAVLALSLGWAGRYAEAEQVQRRAVELAPGALEWHAYLSRFQLLQGRVADAAVSAEKEPGERYRLFARALVLAQKDRPAADALIQELIERYGQREASYVAEYHAMAGDADRAFEWLEKARAHRETFLVWILVQPTLKSLRTDPRWPEFVRKVGLAPGESK